ncbi:MAG: YihY/virulence factor BrkB family protein [Balneola sp.]
MNYLEITKQTVLGFIDNKPMSYSSSIAFYVILSLPAILMIVITIAGTVFDDAVVRQTLIQEIENLFGGESASATEKVLENTQEIGTTLIAKIVGVFVLIFSATTVFISLQDGLNSIWGVKAKPEKNFIKFVLNRLVSFAMVVSISFILIVSLALDATVTILNENVFVGFPNAPASIIRSFNFILSFFITSGILSIILKVLPEVHIKWKDVWMGALFATILFTAGKYLISIYLTNSPLGSVYGAAGSLVLLLIWVYYSSVILLLGAQFTVEYSKENGSIIKSYDHVVIVKETERETGRVNEES